MDLPIQLIVKVQQFEDKRIEAKASWNIKELKGKLSEIYPTVSWWNLSESFLHSIENKQEAMCDISYVAVKHLQHTRFPSIFSGLDGGEKNMKQIDNLLMLYSQLRIRPSPSISI